MGKIYGYIRELPGKMDVEKQVDLMHEMQVGDRNIFIDRQEAGNGGRNNTKIF